MVHRPKPQTQRPGHTGRKPLAKKKHWNPLKQSWNYFFADFHEVWNLIWNFSKRDTTFSTIYFCLFLKKQDEAHEPECRHVCWVTETILLLFATFSSEPAGGTPWLETLRWHSCRTPLLDTIAQRSGKTLLLDTPIWHSLIWHFCGTLLLDSPKDLRGTPEIGFRCDTFCFEIFWDILRYFEFYLFFLFFLFVFVYFCLFLFIFVYWCLWLFMFVYCCLFLCIFVCCTVGFTVVKSMLSINIHHHSIIINRITHAEKMRIVSFRKHIWYNHLKSTIVSNNNQMWHCCEKRSLWFEFNNG